MELNALENRLTANNSDRRVENRTYGNVQNGWLPKTKNRFHDNSKRSSLANMNLGSSPFTSGVFQQQNYYHGETILVGDKKDKQKQKNQQQQKRPQVELDTEYIEEFVKEFTDNKTNTTVLRELLGNKFTTVANIVSTKYFDNKYTSALPSMNKVIKLMELKLFATTLIVMIKDGIFEENWGNTKSDIAGLIGISLDTSANKMREETISTYVEIISDYIYPNEIKEMVAILGIDEDTATDTVISIPYFGREFTEIQLKNFVPKFWAIINEHSDLLIDTMNAENQMKLFYYIFPDKDNKQLKKAIGKCLTYEYINIPEADAKSYALYKEYVSALYMMLDDLDIEDIQYVLKYVNNEVEKNLKMGGNPLVYDESLAIHFENISKAIQN